MSKPENDSRQAAMDMQARTYFDSLPELLKSQIVESGASLTTREELEQYCKNALGGLGMRN